ncbi:autotransporter outer membrane beta-barrel domain-containing protein [Endozoicomonas elysicola]|uniref:Autotransporter domain-containing protein n=1 Tax=Endozoicomonas elysicola TaxID=305900 RepID=A0A081K901_9GAMM|nr:autotransporter outer membrane beta-barrel domain-containing protein [Endozoicomonas elysicola]KEI70627.1 hypothetical protein GV64_07620 [Endozoicomonas elysicola]
MAANAEDSTLSGNITVNLSTSAPGTGAVFAAQNGQMSGTVDSLKINLLSSRLNGIESQQGAKIDLNGPISITNSRGLEQNHGMWTGLDQGMHFTGPVDISLQGISSFGVASMPGEITFDDSLKIDISGSYSSGIYLFPMMDTPAAIHLNGATNIHASGQDTSSLTILGGSVYVNNTLNASTSNGASTINMMATNPTFGSLLTTNSPSAPQEPNPQKILLQGKIHLSNGFNQMMLDLAADSLINSQLEIAQGNVSWQFHSPSAKWITIPGSIIGSQGNLIINFISEGTWQVPLSSANQATNSAAVAPLIIEQGGEFVVRGQGTVLGNVQTELQAGEEQKFVLVKKTFADNGGLNLDLSTLSTQTDRPGYTLTLEQHNEANAGYLYATLAKPEDPAPPDPSHKAIPWTPLAPSSSTPSSATIAQNSSFSQQLPVNMVDQMLASKLLHSTLSTSFCKKTGNPIWIGQCLDPTDEPFSLWALPLYDHIAAKDLNVAIENIGFKANIRGLGLQLARETHWGNWGGGLFSGKGDINSTELNIPIRSDVDYLGGLIHGAVKANPFIVNLGVTYLHSKHRLRQYNNNHHLKSDSEIDVAGIQARMAWPDYYGNWLITPAAHLEFWHTHQPGNEITGDGNNTYVRAKANQYFRQLPLSITAQGPNLMLGTHDKIRLIPQFDIRFIPTWGDRQLYTEVSLKNNPDMSVSLSTPEMDKSSTELGVGLQIASGLIDSNLRYNARHSSHILSQQISADIVWRF